MSKSPSDPKEIFPEVISGCKEVFAEDLISIILYGSAAGEDYRPGKSDINFMIVLNEEGIESLDRAFGMVKKWRKKGIAVPLFLSEHYIETSQDVFPIEYLNFKRNHLLVFGKDPLSSLTFDKELVRLQCERELKGKLLLLRESFIESQGRAQDLKDVIKRSLMAFVAVFEALLYLKDKEHPPGKREILKTTCDTFDLDFGVFQKLMDIKEDRLKAGDAEVMELFKDYLKQVKILTRTADQLGG